MMVLRGALSGRAAPVLIKDAGPAPPVGSPTLAAMAIGVLRRERMAVRAGLAIEVLPAHGAPSAPVFELLHGFEVAWIDAAPVLAGRSARADRVPRVTQVVKLQFVRDGADELLIHQPVGFLLPTPGNRPAPVAGGRDVASPRP